MLKRGWGAESNGKLPHLFIPSKTATLVPEFAAEDFTLGRTASLGSCACSEGPSLGQHTLMIKAIHCKLRHMTAVLPKGRSSAANSGSKVAVLLGMNRCGSFPLLFAFHSLSLVSEQTLKDLRSSQGPQSGGEESGFGLLGLHLKNYCGSLQLVTMHRTSSIFTNWS